MEVGLINGIGEHPKLKLKAVGDILLGDSPYCIGHGVGSKINKKGPLEYVKAVSALLDDADVFIGNLECVLSRVGRNRLRLGSIELRGDPASIGILTRAKTSVLNVANNHTFQHGLEAYRDTVGQLLRAGVTVIGDEERQVSLPTVELYGIRLGFLGFSLRPEQYQLGQKTPYALRTSGKAVMQEIARARRDFDGILIVSLHWGMEFIEHPSREQQSLARNVVSEGADLILGHHPHVVQGVERYKHGLIAYSLGNFVFDFVDSSTRDSIVLEIDVARHGMVGYKIIPVKICRDHVPRVTEGAERRRIAGRVQILSDQLTKWDLKEEILLSEEAHRAYTRFRHACYRYFLRYFYRYNPYYYTASLLRAMFRRIGILHNP